MQFLHFIQPHTQQLLIHYQIEIVPVPIVDLNKEANSYNHLQIDRPYIGLNSEIYILITLQESEHVKRMDMNFFVKNFLW